MDGYSLSILLLASGRGTRLGSEIPKAYVEVGGKPLVLRSFEQLCRAFPNASIVLAVHPDDRDPFVTPLGPAFERACIRNQFVIVDGGATRQQSMERALAGGPSGTELVLVHDAARPFFSIEAAQDAVAAAAEHGAALLAVPAPDTLKRVAPDGSAVVDTIPREGIWQAQTPQVVRRSLLERNLHTRAAVTDDVSLVEGIDGCRVVPVLGSRTNIKVTTPEDLVIAEALARHADAATQNEP